MPRRLLLLTHYFEPENGAPQRRWRALIERLVMEGWSVDVIAPLPHHPSGTVPIALQGQLSIRGGGAIGEHGGRVHRVSFLPHDSGIVRRTLDHVWVAGATVWRALSLIRRGTARPDVIVATAPALPTILAGHVLAKRLRLPLVIEMRDAWPDLVSHTPGLIGARSAKATAKRIVHDRITVLQRRAAAVVTTTESFAEVLRERAVRRVYVVRNGTVPETYEAVGEREGDSSELRVLYMGTTGRSQGLDVLVRAAAQLRDEGREISVRIVGTGADHAQLGALNARFGGVVDLRDVVAPSEVLEHYRWADTCVASLRDWGPFRWTVPSKLYELMATGRHVTAVLAGEGAEIVRETRSGAVVPPGDAAALADALRGLSEHRERLVISDAGQRWVREHADFRMLAGRYAILLANVVESARR